MSPTGSLPSPIRQKPSPSKSFIWTCLTYAPKFLMVSSGCSPALKKVEYISQRAAKLSLAKLSRSSRSTAVLLNAPEVSITSVTPAFSAFGKTAVINFFAVSLSHSADFMRIFGMCRSLAILMQLSVSAIAASSLISEITSIHGSSSFIS